MKTIAIYNNKGGVGKSTSALFLADFFSSFIISKRKARILVMDLDSQGSASISLLGLEKVAKARSEKRCISYLLLKAKQGKKVVLNDYLHVREKGHTSKQKIPLRDLWVMTPDRDSTIQFENSCDQNCCRTFARFLREYLTKSFDIVFIDLPPNIDERNKLSIIGLLLADYILIPTEPTRITVNSFTDTMNMIQYVRGVAGAKEKAPEIVGVLLNKTDRRTKQYKLHHNEIFEMAANHNTTVFTNFLPGAPALSSASDDSLEFSTLKEKYSNYYDHVRKVSIELAKRCGYNVKLKR